MTDLNASDIKMGKKCVPNEVTGEDVGGTNHRIIDLVRLEKTLELIEPNHKWDIAQISITAQLLAVEEHSLDYDEEEARERPSDEFSLSGRFIGHISLSLIVS